MGTQTTALHGKRAVRRVAWWAFTVLGLVLLAACGDAASPAPVVQRTDIVPTRTLVPPTATATGIPVPITPAFTDLPGAAGLVPVTEAATEELTQRALIAQALDALVAEYGFDPAAVRLVSFDAFTWPDGSWGCASAENAPSVVRDEQTPGYRVVFSADGRAFVYHTDIYGDLLRCADRTWLALEGTPVVLDPIAEAMLELSRREAARQLEQAPESFMLVSLLTLNWPDASMGCPKAGIDYDERETPGYRVVFEAADGQRVIYHTSVRDVVRCAPAEEILPGMLRRALPDEAPAADVDAEATAEATTEAEPDVTADAPEE